MPASRSDEELLSAELLDGLSDLEWVARLVARGVGVGVHPSAFVGRGEEFERHRPYQQGDDLRHLDWRLLARTDRLYVRRFRETSNLRAVLALDASASMGFGGRDAGVSKLRYAALVAAALGYLFRRVGDRPGLAVSGGWGDRADAFLPPRAGSEAWRTILHRLTELQAGGRGSLAATLEQVGERVPRGGRLVILSDFLEDDRGREVAEMAGRLRARGDEVVAVRILTPLELGETDAEEALYTDPENPERTRPGTPSRDPGYRHRLHTYYDELRQTLAERGVMWREARTSEGLVPLIRSWVR